MSSIINIETDLEIVFKKEIMPHINHLYNYAFHQLKCNEQDAQDIVQETMLKAWRAIDSFKPGTNAKAWLFTIAKNTYFNYLRKSKREGNKVELRDGIEYQNSQRHWNLEQNYYSNKLEDDVTQAVNGLNDKFRALIILCDIEGFKYKEAAALLEIPVGSVRSGLHSARNKLREKLEKHPKSNWENKRK